MILFKKLRGYTYLLDKSTNVIHDLSRTKLSECKKTTKNIKRKHRKYLRVDRAMDILASKANGCEFCLPGFNKERKTK